MVCVWILSPHIFHLESFFPFVCLKKHLRRCDEYATPAQVLKRGQSPQSWLLTAQVWLLGILGYSRRPNAITC